LADIYAMPFPTTFASIKQVFEQACQTSKEIEDGYLTRSGVHRTMITRISAETTGPALPNFCPPSQPVRVRAPKSPPAENRSKDNGCQPETIAEEEHHLWQQSGLR